MASPLCSVSGAYNEERFTADLARVVDDVGRYPLLVSSQPFAMAALSSLLHTLSLPSSSFASHKYALYALNVHQHAKLDHSSFIALSLFPATTTAPFASASSSSSSSSAASSDLSLFSFLNHTKTPMGARLLSRFLRQPLLSLAEIGVRHELVSFFVSHTSIRAHLRESSACLRRCPDVESILRKLQREKAKLLDVVRLYQVVVKVGAMREALEADLAGDDSAVARARYAAPLRECEVAMEQFVAMCDRAIDMDSSERAWYAEATMRGDFSPDLQALEQRRSALRESMAAIQRRVEEELKLPGKVGFDYLTCHLRITNKEEHRARLSHPYIVVDSKRDGTRFTTAELKALASEYKAVVREYSERQAVYVSKLIETTLTYAVVVERMSGLIAEMDVLVAFAHVAASLDGFVRPVMRELGSGVLKMKASRHPLLEGGNAGPVRVGDDEEGNAAALSGAFIPNDVDMVQGRSHCQIITGPNMGGQRSRIRTALPCCACVCPAPHALCVRGCGACRQEHVHPTDRRVLPARADRDVRACAVRGADHRRLHPLPHRRRRHSGQRRQHVSASRNAPTHRALSDCQGDSAHRIHGRCSRCRFMQEMLETAQILHLATPHSLVIVDEMGRGTSTEDGLALAWATAESIASRGAFSLFATHFHEMRALADEGLGCINLHVTALVKDGALEYLYEVKPGASEESFGVECMALARFDPGLVQLARSVLSSFDRERIGAHGQARNIDGVRKRVAELKARAEQLRARAGTDDAERRKERARIHAEAVELKHRLQRSMEATISGR